MTSAYRDDMQPLRDELRGLEQRLAETQAQTERLTALQADQATLEKEVTDLRRRLFAHDTRRAQPNLDNVRIATPCKVPWDSMIGDERVRHCNQCDKSVYNVAGMTREEAERLLTDTSGTPCMRIFRRADGTVLTSDCPVGVKRKRRLAIFGIAGGAAAGIAGAFGYMTTATMGDVEMVGQMEVVQGGAMPMPPPAPIDTAAKPAPAKPPAPVSSPVVDPVPAVPAPR